MTIAENVATMNESEIEISGFWRPWGTPIQRPNDGVAHAFAWALRRTDSTDLFAVVGQDLFHFGDNRWNPLVALRGQPVMNGLAAVAVNGLPLVFALTSEALLQAAFDGTKWSFKRLPEVPFGGVTQLLAVHDVKDTDLFVVTRDGKVFSLRLHGEPQWKEVLPAGSLQGYQCGAAASAPGRRELATGSGETVRLFVSENGGAYREEEALRLPFPTKRVMLVSPETDVLYAVALAEDARAAMSPWYRQSSGWGQRIDGAAGNTLGSVTNAVSPRRGRIDVLSTDLGGRFCPRLFDK